MLLVLQFASGFPTSFRYLQTQGCRLHFTTIDPHANQRSEKAKQCQLASWSMCLTADFSTCGSALSMICWQSFASKKEEISTTKGCKLPQNIGDCLHICSAEYVVSKCNNWIVSWAVELLISGWSHWFLDRYWKRCRSGGFPFATQWEGHWQALV